MSNQIDPKAVPQIPDVRELALVEMDQVSGGIRLQEETDKRSDEQEKK